ncbi:UNVERIFIED_CONTAM: hypothetical protein RF648_06365 [Kocuria sp. CPCC 205274]
MSGGQVEILEPLTDTGYGSHQFTIRDCDCDGDCDGDLRTVGTYRGA